jgi:hypothetical protein
MYRDYENQVAQYGMFNQSADANGAHYFGKESNAFAKDGMNCANCVFYIGGGGCEIVEGKIDPMGLCKLWIIPESLIEEQTEPFPDTEFIEKHREGQHDQKTHGAWADGIADEINSGKQPTIEGENLTAFLSKAAMRDDHPDITELRIDGTLLFGGEGLGIQRKDMPQVPAERRTEFLTDIARDKGIQVQREDVDPRTLKPVQSEVSAARSGAIYRKFADKQGIPEKQAILISNDGYVIDGHHTWAASVGYAFDFDAKLPVYRLSVDAKPALEAALEWSKAQGIESQAIDAKVKKMLEAFEKHGTHDQKTHGRWAASQTDPNNIPLKVADIPANSSRSAEAVSAATKLREQIEKVEPQITKDLVDVANEVGGTFPEIKGRSTLEQRVKSTDSLARKIDADAEKEYNGDRDQAAAKISDAVRYTINFEENQYTDSTQQIVSSLTNKGYEVQSIKNFWRTGDPYDGVNMKLKKDGVLVEVQLHTQNSLRVKEEKLHPKYEVYRESQNNRQRRALWNSMVKIAEEIPRPAKYQTLLAVGTVVVQNYETAQQAGLLKSSDVRKEWFIEEGVAICVISLV